MSRPSLVRHSNVALDLVNDRLGALMAASRGAVVALLLLSSVSCQTQLIPNTDVEDTEENREIIQFCEEYRRAVETRNTALLLKLAHPAYYEDGGNIDSTDDLDYAGLKDYLSSKFRQTKGIRYEIRYRRVGDGRYDRVYVDYTFSASYKLTTEKGDLWQRAISDNRLELVRLDGKYRILSGM